MVFPLSPISYYLSLVSGGATFPINMKLTIKEMVVYTPAKDFDVSKRFYAALGFELTEGWGKTMDCRLRGTVFRLQDLLSQRLGGEFHDEVRC